MVKTICVRGPTLARLAMVLVLLSIGNTPALRVTSTLRVITLHWEYSCSTSYLCFTNCFPWWLPLLYELLLLKQENTPRHESLLFEFCPAINNSSASHSPLGIPLLPIPGAIVYRWVKFKNYSCSRRVITRSAGVFPMESNNS